MLDENRAQDTHHTPIALSDSIRVLWSYRNAFVLTLLIAVLVVGIIAIVATLRSPGDRVAELRFTLEFDGAAQGRYPSDVGFSPRDITSDPVLKQVFESNDLRRFLTYEDFSNSVFVYQTSIALELLMKEYEAKLANLKLSPVDRERIEARFKARQAALKSAEYELHLQRPGSVASIPEELQAKVLSEVLATWADWAALRKGALDYNVPLFSTKVVRAGLFESEEYLVAADLLHRDIESSIEVLGDLKELPGSHSIRVGEAELSLAEVEARLEELLRFKLEPFVGWILQTRLARDPAKVTTYLETRLARTVLEQKEAQGRIRMLEDALFRFLDQGTPGLVSTDSDQRGNSPQDVTTYVSQFNDPFLDRLLKMASETQDAVLRQQITTQHVEEGEHLVQLTKQANYYRTLLETFSAGSRAAGGRSRAQLTDRSKERFEELEAETLAGLDLISSLYEQISAYNLNPRNLLYTTVSPVSFRQTNGGVLRTRAIYSMLALVLVVLLFPIGCLVHYNLSRTLGKHEQGRALAGRG